MQFGAGSKQMQMVNGKEKNLFAMAEQGVMLWNKLKFVLMLLGCGHKLPTDLYFNAGLACIK